MRLYVVFPLTFPFLTIFPCLYLFGMSMNFDRPPNISYGFPSRRPTKKVQLSPWILDFLMSHRSSWGRRGASEDGIVGGRGSINTDFISPEACFIIFHPTIFFVICL